MVGGVIIVFWRWDFRIERVILNVTSALVAASRGAQIQTNKCSWPHTLVPSVL